MLKALSILLSLLNLVRILHANEEFSTTNEPPPENDACDKEMLATIIQKIDELNFATENLFLKIGTLNLIFDQQFTELKEELKKRSSQNKETGAGTNAATYTDTNVNTNTKTSTDTNANIDTDPKIDNVTNNNTDNTKIHRKSPQPLECFYSYEHLIDVRSNLDDDETNLPVPPLCLSGSPFVPKEKLPSNCGDAVRLSGRGNGIYKIHLPESRTEPFYVYCEEDPDEPGNAWTIVQRRSDGSVDFYRKWNDYVHGFGNLEGEFWIGLEKLHALTQSSLHELWIELEDFDNDHRWAKYSSFAIAGENQSYSLSVLGLYSGNAGDSLRIHAGEKFTTLDVDNDHHKQYNCAINFSGGWWYNQCHESNLNGQYLRGLNLDKFGKGVIWYKFREHYYSLKYAHMAIRPVRMAK